MDFLLGRIFFGIDFFFLSRYFFSLYIFLLSKFFFSLEFFFSQNFIFSLKKILYFAIFLLKSLFKKKKKNYQRIFSLKLFLLKSFFIKNIYGKKAFVKKKIIKKKKLRQNLFSRRKNYSFIFSLQISSSLLCLSSNSSQSFSNFSQ